MYPARVKRNVPASPLLSSPLTEKCTWKRQKDHLAREMVSIQQNENPYILTSCFLI